MASYDAGSVNMRDTVFPNTVPFLREMGGAFLERKVLPEVEVFEAGHIDTALRLRDEGVLEDPLHFNLVLGVRGGAPGTIAQAVFMLAMIPDDASWSICGLGRTQLPLNVFGLVAGGHVRTGLEDNMNYARGELATNPQLVERIVRIAAEVGRPVASPAEAREILSLPR
jgi:3-keto-5-aminohexanoate cleavage enzyme